MDEHRRDDRSGERDASEVTLWGRQVDEDTYEAAHYGADRAAPTPPGGQAAIAQGTLETPPAETLAERDQFTETSSRHGRLVPQEDDPAQRPTI